MLDSAASSKAPLLSRKNIQQTRALESEPTERYKRSIAGMNSASANAVDKITLIGSNVKTTTNQVRRDLSLRGAPTGVYCN